MRPTVAFGPAVGVAVATASGSVGVFGLAGVGCWWDPGAQAAATAPTAARSPSSVYSANSHGLTRAYCGMAKARTSCSNAWAPTSAVTAEMTTAPK